MATIIVNCEKHVDMNATMCKEYNDVFQNSTEMKGINFDQLSESMDGSSKEEWEGWFELDKTICARYVNIVSAKTHKITYYTDEAKCVLMEVNSYFEVYFNNGLNIHLLEEFIRIFDDRLKIDIKVLSKFASAVLAPHYQKALETVNKVRNLYLKIILF